MQQIDLKDQGKKKLTADEIKELLLVKYKKYTIMAVLFLMLLLVKFMVGRSLAASESDAMNLYKKYQSTLYAMQQTKGDKVRTKTVVIPSDTAVNLNKVKKDVDAAESCIRSWFSWSDGKSYDKARADVLSVCGEKSDMAKLFAENPVIDEETGETAVDAQNAEMQVVSITTYPADIKTKGDNTYISVLNVSIPNASGDSNHTIIVRYMVNSKNKITDVSTDFVRE